MDIDLTASDLDSLMRKYLRYKFMGEVGEKALGALGPESAEEKRRKKGEVLDIALKKKALGLEYNDDDLDEALNDRHPLVPSGLERQALIGSLGRVPRPGPASIQTERQVLEIFGKLPPNKDNLVKLGIKPLVKEAKSNAYPLKRAASILAAFGI